MTTGRDALAELQAWMQQGRRSVEIINTALGVSVQLYADRCMEDSIDENDENLEVAILAALDRWKKSNPCTESTP